MRKIIDNGLWKTIYDTDKADLILRYIPENFISQWLKYPMVEVYKGRWLGAYFKVYIFPKGKRRLKPVYSSDVEELVTKYFHEDSEIYKKYGPKTLEAKGYETTKNNQIRIDEHLPQPETGRRIHRCRAGRLGKA